MPATTTLAKELTPEELKTLETITEGSNKFAISLYQAVRKPGENVIVSPISVQIVLALAYSGAKGDTAKQIASVLKLPENPDTVLNGHHLLLQQLQNPVLQLATKMFIEETLKVKPEFQSNAAKYFQSEAGLVSFIKDAEGARKGINQWVEEKTNKKITNLLGQGVLDALTRMVLVNAIYFKDNWQFKFDKQETVKEDFFVTPQSKIKVDMMYVKKRFSYVNHEGLDAKILEMPYANNEFKMIIILPNELDGLAAVENKLATLDITQVLSRMYPVEVHVKLPRFKIESTMELKDVLADMGIKDIFDEGKANLNGISDEKLYASKVVQKAFIEVNEEGTEAAAATGEVIMAVFSAIESTEPEIYFTANHPFIYILTIKKRIFFIGRSICVTKSKVQF